MARRLATAVLLLAMIGAIAGAAEPVWVGRMTFDYGATSFLDWKHADEKGTSSRYLDEKLAFTVVVKACGHSGEHLRIQEPEVRYSMSERASFQARETGCLRPSTGPGDPGPLVTVRRPGDSDRTEASFTGSAYPGFAGYVAEPGLAVDPDRGTYSIRYQIPRDPAVMVTGASRNEKTYVCEADTHTFDLTYAGKLIVPKDCPPDGNACSATVPAIERSVPLTVFHTGAYAGEGEIRGSVFYPDAEAIGGITVESLASVVPGVLESLRELGMQLPAARPELAAAEAELRQSVEEGGKGREASEKGMPSGAGEPARTETLGIEWEFVLETECDAVIEQLREDLSLLRAYADEELCGRTIAEGGDGEAYEARIAQEGLRQYGTRWWGGGGGAAVTQAGGVGAGIEIGTNDMTCEIENVDEVREDYREKCYPDVLIESHLVHEGVHQRQCRGKTTGDAFRSRTPESFRRFEIEAYCAAGEFLLGYAGRICREGDTDPYVRELQRLCRP